MSQRKILGDYQTPLPLARQIVSHLFTENQKWERILEPTCGLGNFVRACIEQYRGIKEIIGLDIQPHYVETARGIRSEDTKISILQQDIFEQGLKSVLEWESTSPLLIIGNPPWITNSEQGRLNGSNLPLKTNFQHLSGLDAITGKSNFDIAEVIWLKLINDFISDPVTIALLCKTSVARKVAQYVQSHELSVNRMSLYHIDSQRWFDVAVDACLFVMELNQGDSCYNVSVYDTLESQHPTKTMGFANGKTIADIHSYSHVSFLDGTCPLIWRQGVKHDASKIMELTRRDGHYLNGYGQVVDVEGEYLYPLLKSSDVNSIMDGFPPRKYVIVTQKRLQQKTVYLESEAPNLWRYLNSNADKLDRRKSSIYRNAPRFSMFGIGDYTFSPYKVVVSGFYFPAKFVKVSSFKSKVYLTDDTCYFMSFHEEWKALLVTALLNHPSVQAFLNSLVFPDSKRPITKSLLDRINLNAVYESLDIGNLHDSIGDISETLEPRDDAFSENQLFYDKQLLLL